MNPYNSSEAFGLVFDSIKKGKIESVSEVVKDADSLNDAIVQIRLVLEEK